MQVLMRVSLIGGRRLVGWLLLLLLLLWVVWLRCI